MRNGEGGGYGGGCVSRNGPFNQILNIDELVLFIYSANIISLTFHSAFLYTLQHWYFQDCHQAYHKSSSIVSFYKWLHSLQASDQSSRTILYWLQRQKYKWLRRWWTIQGIQTHTQLTSLTHGRSNTVLSGHFECRYNASRTGHAALIFVLAYRITTCRFMHCFTLLYSTNVIENHFELWWQIPETSMCQNCCLFVLVYFVLNLDRPFNTVLAWLPESGVQTVKCYPDQNWLWGLWHPLYLPQKSDVTFCIRVEDLNQSWMMLLFQQPNTDFIKLTFDMSGRSSDAYGTN